MKIKILPQSNLGIWAVGLAALWPLLTIAGYAIVGALYPGAEAGATIIDDFRLRPWLAIIMMLGLAAGVAAFPASLLAIFKKQERSIFVFLAAVLSLFLVYLLIGELVSPH